MRGRTSRRCGCGGRRDRAGRTPTAEVDVQVGGRLRLVMRDPDGNEFGGEGTYLTLDRPRRLAFSWRWDMSALGAGRQLVDVRFNGNGTTGTTTVLLTNTGLAETEQESHREGGTPRSTTSTRSCARSIDEEELAGRHRGELPWRAGARTVSAAAGRWFRSRPVVSDAAFQSCQSPTQATGAGPLEHVARDLARGGWWPHSPGAARRLARGLAGPRRCGPGTSRVTAARRRRRRPGLGSRSPRNATFSLRARAALRDAVDRASGDSGRSDRVAAPDAGAAAPLCRDGCAHCRSASGLQGCMLWVPVEKLFQTRDRLRRRVDRTDGRRPCAAVVPLLEVPTGILADRWSRTGILIMSSAAAAASALVRGPETATTRHAIVAAMILGVYFRHELRTVDSVVYDTVMEEAGSAATCTGRWIGRVRIVESAAFASSALLGGLIAGWTTPRVTLHAHRSRRAGLRRRVPSFPRAAAGTAPPSGSALRQHVATTIGAMTSRPPGTADAAHRRAHRSLLSQAVFRVRAAVAGRALDAPDGRLWPVLGPAAWPCAGLGGRLAGKLDLQARPDGHRPRRPAGRRSRSCLAASHALLVVALAHRLSWLALSLAIVGIHAGRAAARRAVPPTIRAGRLLRRRHTLVGVVSAVLAGVRCPGPQPRPALGGWMLTGVTATLALLLLVVIFTGTRPTGVCPDPISDDVTRLAALAPTPAGSWPAAGSSPPSSPTTSTASSTTDWRAPRRPAPGADSGGLLSGYLDQIRAIVEPPRPIRRRIKQQLRCRIKQERAAHRSRADT